MLVRTRRGRTTQMVGQEILRSPQKSVWHFLAELNTWCPNHPVIESSGICPREMKIHMKVHMWVKALGSFITAPNWDNKNALQRVNEGRAYTLWTSQQWKEMSLGHTICQRIILSGKTQPPKLTWASQVVLSLVQSLSRVWLFATPWTTAHQASLSITNSQSSPKPMYTELVMPSNHLILCCPLLLLPSIFPSIRAFSNESALHIRWPKYWSFSFNISPPVNTQDWSPLGWTGWISLYSKGLSRVFSNTTVQKHQFFGAQLSFIVQLSYPSVSYTSKERISLCSMI